MRLAPPEVPLRPPRAVVPPPEMQIQSHVAVIQNQILRVRKAAHKPVRPADSASQLLGPLSAHKYT